MGVVVVHMTMMMVVVVVGLSRCMIDIHRRIVTRPSRSEIVMTVVIAIVVAIDIILLTRNLVISR